MAMPAIESDLGQVDLLGWYDLNSLMLILLLMTAFNIDLPFSTDAQLSRQGSSLVALTRKVALVALFYWIPSLLLKLFSHSCDEDGVMSCVTAAVMYLHLTYELWVCSSRV